MSENASQPVFRMTEWEFEAYIKEKLPRLRCSGCGDSDFDPMVAGDLSIAQLRLHETQVSFFPAAGTICKNCGLIYLIYREQLIKWLAARNKDQNDG